MSTRCKMYLMSKKETANQTITKIVNGEIAVDEKGKRQTEQGPAYDLTFSAVYHNDDPKHENSRFWAYTPSATFEVKTVNPAVADKLVVGKEYYVDITPVE